MKSLQHIRISSLQKSVYTIIRATTIASSIDEMKSIRKSIERNKSVGFVPTMGALHEGHLKLVELSKERNDVTVASIFVNPTQFSAGEDLDKYPRTLQSDLQKLQALGVDIVFTPTKEQMYKPDSLCHIEPAAFSNISEGVKRPEFFRGVATIVCKLFNIVQPTTSYFGQKDISQCILVRRMVDDLNIDGNIHVIETVREADGLALSSRNAYLTPEERTVAKVLYQALSSAKQLCERHAQSTVSRAAIIAAAEDELNKEALVTLIEYISVASHINMREVEFYAPQNGVPGVVLSAAIRVGKVRLIDNLLVGQAITDILNEP